MHFSLFFENKNTGGFYFSEFENFIPQFRLFSRKITSCWIDCAANYTTPYRYTTPIRR